MKTIYKLKGLDCPHCAGEIESAVRKLDGVDSADVNLMKQELSVESSQGSEALCKAVVKTVHKYEPDVEVAEIKRGEHHHDHHEGEHHHDHHEGEHHHDHHDHHGGEHHHDHHEDEHHHDHHDHHGGEHHHDHCECEHHHDHHEGEHHHDHCECGHSGANHDHSKAARTVVYTLDEVDCPNCAAEIENALLRADGVVSAEINLIKQELTIGLDGDFSGDAYALAKKTVGEVEPGTEVIDKAENCGNAPKKPNIISRIFRSEKATVVRFAIGAALYGLSFLIQPGEKMPTPPYLVLLILAYIILGADVLLGAVRNIFRGRIFDEKFLMTVSTVGAFVIGEYPEAVAVMLFYQIGEFFQSLAVKRSRRSISDLMDIRPDSANLLCGSEIKTTAPENVKVGDVIVVKAGEKIPLDGIITLGETMLDTRALTGESMPRKAKEGDEVLSGCINESGVIRVRVTKPFGESTAAKILDLVENAAGRKAPTENFISVFARFYTPIVVALAVGLAVIPPLVTGGNWAQWIHRCFVFLVISCPCALVISIPLTFFGGIGAASRRGVLVKGSNYLEALASVDALVLDKTGTLTKGTFSVTKLMPADGVSSIKLLETAAAAEKMSDHPIARSIIAAYGGSGELSAKDHREISGHGVTAAGQDGQKIYAGSMKLMRDNGIECDTVHENGTIVYVAEGGKYLGAIVIADEIKPESKSAIEGVYALGVKRTVMLTGDNEKTARAVAEEIGIDEFYSGLLPADKVERVEKMIGEMSEGGKLAFVGDGINDAPVLARADVGIAMGALGTDAAIEAADVVLMNDDPSSICDAIRIAKHTKRIVTENIVLVLLVKIVILALGALGLASMWSAVFGDVGVMILAVLNAMRVIRKR